ncbi:retrovirus-related Pol polyprotein from type-1 retrotransposable element R2 [Trichonephila inaurata madagascariensis]|uniref:Retrovirus-related Pol polyprotein from type-1 retrotransposable element R2 n=1 Tax=Trichonephila inaurata madagascariensis TaxID=2747483 RepID=A0A8X6X6P3_9ARAC|nr:retrovirus-related Pol polyprotein from type-1 retrotransposable element R2 [Trichonephila inaurata madagascariensis]
MKNFKTVNEALALLQKVATSNLAPWQKLDAMKTFFFPSLCFSMRTAQVDKTGWRQVDIAVAKEVKNILNLPERATNHYLLADRKKGGCGIPSAAADCDFYLVDTAFKLLTSRDEDVAIAALGQLRRTVRHRIHRAPTDGDLSSYLSGCMEGEFATSSNALSNTWTQARKASSRQEVTWTFTNGSPTIAFADDVLTATSRTSVLRKFHLSFKEAETEKLIAQPSQGKAMECVSFAQESSHFITGGLYTRFADWRFIHKARLNVTQLNGSKPWISGRQRKCRKCGQWDENLPHVLNHCKSYSAAWQMRHNAIVRRIKTAVAFKGTILSENQAVGHSSNVRPDLVATVGNTLYIIDITIPFEDRKDAFAAAAKRKVEKYSPLIPYFNQLGYESVEIVPVIVGALGSLQ